MNRLKLNETPIRTSRNFNINNITLDNIQMPEKIESFENVQIVGEGSKIDENCSKPELMYGLSEFLTNQVVENSNQKIHLEFDDNTEKEIKVCFHFDENNVTLMEHIEIVAKEDAQATIFVKYVSKDKIKCFHNGVLRVFAKKGAKVNVVFVNWMNTISEHFMAIENQLEENAKVQYTIIDFGGKNSVTNFYSNLVGENSENKIHTIYLGKENQMFDLNYIGELRGRGTKLEMEIQGALKDVSKKHFKGTIDFKKGCKEAKGSENEGCMLLSDTAKSIALPMLLCAEEEVEGNHSSSAGKIGEKELFYLMSRGFKQKEAMKLMVQAKFNTILEKIENEELREAILKKMDERLD